jgi:hypothetical protein
MASEHGRYVPRNKPREQPFVVALRCLGPEVG